MGFFLCCVHYILVFSKTLMKKVMSQAVNPSVTQNFQSTWAELQLSQSLNAGTPLPDIFVIIGSSDNHRSMWNLSSVSHFCAPMLTRASPALLIVPMVFSDVFPANSEQFPRPAVSKTRYPRGATAVGSRAGEQLSITVRTESCPIPWGWHPFCRPVSVESAWAVSEFPWFERFGPTS